MSFIILVGLDGKMSKLLQHILKGQSRDYKIFSSKALSLDSFAGAEGVIDFSLPEAAKVIAQKSIEAKIPWICGTTGWTSDEQFNESVLQASKKIPVVFDSNFSLGVELLCQMSELLAKNLNVDMAITDIHHDQKRDAPSGTAIKIAKRIEGQGSKSVQINSIRLGDIPGEHRVLV